MPPENYDRKLTPSPLDPWDSIERALLQPGDESSVAKSRVFVGSLMQKLNQRGSQEPAYEMTDTEINGKPVRLVILRRHPETIDDEGKQHLGEVIKNKRVILSGTDVGWSSDDPIASILEKQSSDIMYANEVAGRNIREEVSDMEKHIRTYLYTVVWGAIPDPNKRDVIESLLVQNNELGEKMLGLYLYIHFNDDVLPVLHKYVHADSPLYQGVQLGKYIGEQDSLDDTLVSHFEDAFHAYICCREYENVRETVEKLHFTGGERPVVIMSYQLAGFVFKPKSNGELVEDLRLEEVMNFVNALKGYADIKKIYDTPEDF